MARLEDSTPNIDKQKISQSGPKLLEAAVRAHKKGDIKNAESLYLNAIESGFHHEIAFSNLGVIYKTTNRKEKQSPYMNVLLLRIQTSQKDTQISAIYTKISVILIRLLLLLSHHFGLSQITPLHT